MKEEYSHVTFMNNWKLETSESQRKYVLVNSEPDPIYNTHPKFHPNM